MLSLFCLLCAASVHGGEKPNILFIFSDDQCYDTIRAHGNDEIITPNLDRLADTSTTFTTAYNMGGWHGAICVASRTMLQTGYTVWRTRAAESELENLAKQKRLWPQLLNSAGYETYMTGKWHVSIDPAKIFDHVVHPRPGMPKDTPEGYNRPREGEIDVWSPFDQSFGGFWEGGKHWSEVLAEDAEGFLANAATSDKPFFMYLAFNAPHDPRQAPKRFIDMYDPAKLKVPENYRPLYPFHEEIGCGPDARDEALVPFPRSEYAVRVNRQEYYAITTHLDEQIGRILEALEKTGKKDNTYIFFSSDHGLSVGHHGLIGKQNMYEHSLRPPLMVWGPDVPKGECRDNPVYLQDIMATTLELAGVKAPKDLEFHSLLPHIRNSDTIGDYPEIYGCYHIEFQRMIRVGDYKLIVYPHAHTLRLYNLANDPQEMRDLAGDQRHSQRIDEMYARLLELQEELEDPLDLSEFFPERS